MEIIREDAFRKQIKNGLCGGYLFFGDEDYMKAYSVNAARSSVCDDPTFAFFNDIKIENMDYSASALLDALMPLPMMSDKKVVTVNGLNVSGLKPRELDELCDVLQALGEYDYNVLIITVPATLIEEGNIPKNPSAVIKRLGEYLTPVYFESVSVARLVSWVAKHFSANGVKSSPDVCAFLIDYAGRSMYTLSNETDKLSYYVLENGRDTVTREDVLKVSNAELTTDAFGLANAIMEGRGADALDALQVLKFRRIDPVILMSEVSKTISELTCIKALVDEGCPIPVIASTLKINEYRVKLFAQAARDKSLSRLKTAVKLCVEADEALKGSQSQQGYLSIEMLICSL